MGWPTMKIGNHAHSAGVVLKARVVKPLGSRGLWFKHLSSSPQRRRELPGRRWPELSPLILPEA